MTDKKIVRINIQDLKCCQIKLIPLSFQYTNQLGKEKFSKQDEKQNYLQNMLLLDSWIQDPAYLFLSPLHGSDHWLPLTHSSFPSLETLFTNRQDSHHHLQYIYCIAAPGIWLHLCSSYAFLFFQFPTFMFSIFIFY